MIYTHLHRPGKDYATLSNNPASGFARPPQSVYLFAVLLLAIGAVVLVTSGVGAESTIRAQNSATPQPSANAFAFTAYRTFASSDGVIKLQIPDGWAYIPDAGGDKIYTFSPDVQGSSQVVAQIRIRPTSAQFAGLSGITAATLPGELLRMAFAAAGDKTQKIEEITNAGLAGARVYQANGLDENNRPTGRALETRVLRLDSRNVVLIQAVGPTEQWARVAPIINQMIGSLQIDSARALSTVEFAPAPSTAMAPEPQRTPPAIATMAATAAR